MRKKGRGRTTRKRVNKNVCTNASCPFWVFVLFISAWFAVAFLAIAFFYSAIRWPMRQLIPIPEMQGSAEMVDEDIVFGEVVYPQGEEPQDAVSSVSIESCRPLEEGDAEAETVLNWLTDKGNELRQLGQRCVLNDGSVHVTFTFNASVIRSERLYLRYAIALIEDDTVYPEEFYCRTSPRGSPAEMILDGGEVRPVCTFIENGTEIVRYPPVGSRVDIAQLSDPRNLVGIRDDSGDTARDFCIEDDDNGQACQLRNGNWIIHPNGSFGTADSLYLYNKDFELILSSDEDLGYGHNSVQRFIGTEGSSLDIYSRGGDGPCEFSKIIRVNLRTLNAETIFNSEACSG